MKHALIVQQRVLSALIYRELKTRFGHHRLGALWLLLEPLAHMLILSALWAMLGRLSPSGVPEGLFLITGIIPYLFYRNAVSQMMHAVSANKALLIFPQITLMDLILSRLLIEIMVYIVLMASVLACLALLGLPVELDKPANFLLASFILWFTALATAMVCIPLLAIFPVADKIIRILFRVFYLTSGVMFNIQNAPYNIRPYLLANPFFHVIYMIRESLFSEIPYAAEMMNYRYVLFIYSLLFLVGYEMMRRFRLQLLAES